MKLELHTMRFDPESGGFPRTPLDDVGEIVSVVEHFFHHQGWPWLLLVVHKRVPRSTQQPRRGRGEAVGDLSDEERATYEKLRAWRNSRAQADGVPPYAIFTNRQLAELAQRQPTSKKALHEVKGVGKAKAAKYGDAVLEVLGAGT